MDKYNNIENKYQYSSNRQNPKPNTWPAAGTTASELLKTNFRVLIAADLLDTTGFHVFYQEWIQSRETDRRKQLFISALDVPNLGMTSEFSELQQLRYTNCDNNILFFQTIKKMGSWIYLTGDESKVEDAINDAKSAKIFLRVYLLDDKGKLKNCRFFHKKEQHEIKDDAIRIDAFEISTNIAPVHKVMRTNNCVPSEGSIVYTSDRGMIYLKTEFISNPQSITYHTDIPGMQAKIYQAQWLSISYFEDKVRKMLDKKLQCEGVCWPVDLLRNAEGGFVGVLVPAAEGYQLKQQLMSQQGLEEHFPNWNRRQLTHLVKVILEKIVFLQERNVFFGLVNPSSIFIKDENHVFFTEMDTYQIEGYPILTYERVLQAPELQDAPRSMRLYTKQEDNYAIALLVFMILMPGKFPYNKGKNKDISDSIKNMSFAFRYGKKCEEHGTREYFGAWRFAWSHLGNDLKQAFYNTFQREQLYSAPEKRRDARYWLKKVSDLENELAAPYDQESLRIFPRTFKRYSSTRTIKCTKCGIDHPDFYYRFPEKKICNSCLGKPSPTHFECRSCNKTFYYDFGTLFKYEELVTKKAFAMPTHCPYCRSDKRRCVRCGKLVPAYRLNDDNICFDCRNIIVKTYPCKCGDEIKLTQGQYDFYMKKFGRLPQYCDRCRAQRQRGN